MYVTFLWMTAVALQGVATPPVAALSAVSSVSQGCRSYTNPKRPCGRKNSIPIKNFNPGLKISVSIEIFNLDRKFQSRGVSIHGALLVSQRRARLKISIHDRSLEIFNPEGGDRTFSSARPISDRSDRCCERSAQELGSSL